MSVQTFEPGQAVILSDAAKQHFVQQLKADTDAKGIRLSIKESGCTGYAYVVEKTLSPQADDVKIPLDKDNVFYVAANALSVVQGTEIDMVQEGVNRVLSFRNPNVASECGCGESFSVN